MFLSTIIVILIIFILIYLHFTDLSFNLKITKYYGLRLNKYCFS